MATQFKKFRFVLVLMLVIAASGYSQLGTAQSITENELTSQPPLEADARIYYGTDALNFGDLRLPGGEGPHPVAVLYHGGCWLSFASLQYFDRLAVALTELGIATWNLEYRRVDDSGGGWPNTFRDVAAGLDHLREMKEKYDLDLSRVITIGHSSGGHLAMWAGARSNIPETGPLYNSNPLPVSGTLNIAGPPDLEAFRSMDKRVCGQDIVDRLVGGTPQDVPSHYASASPARLLPLGVPQRLLMGSRDRDVPPELGEDYVARAIFAGDDVEMQTVPGAGHFDLVAPWSSFWPVVPKAVQSLINKRN